MNHQKRTLSTKAYRTPQPGALPRPGVADRIKGLPHYEIIMGYLSPEYAESG